MLCLTISVFAFAQINNVKHELMSKAKYSNGAMMTQKSTTFWSEDFANGIPATWTNSTAPWVYRGPTTSPNQNTGTQGAYGNSNTTINSATQANGFIIFDSDYYDNDGVQNNFGGGSYPTPHNGDLKTDIIDLSSYTDVTLMMHSYFRTFQGQAFVRFYVGGQYVDQVQVHSLVAVNDATPVDEVALVRFPAGVCGNADVQIEFQFNGTDQSNQNGSGYYFWMIDDLELMETPSYLLEVLDQNHGGWEIGYASTTGFGMDYTLKPQIQSDANPYMFEMTLANAGAKPLHGIKVNVEVKNGAGTVIHSTSSDTTTLAVYDTTTYMANTPFSPSGIGIYDIDFWASSDSVSATDIVTMQAAITDSVYGRDYNTPEGNWRVARSDCGLQLGNHFDIYVQDEITSVSAYLADWSRPGSVTSTGQMYGVLYEYDTATTSYLPLMQTEDYVIQPGDPNGWVTLRFPQAYTAFPGHYFMAIGGYAHPTDTFGIATSGDAEVTMSRILDPGTCLQPLGSQTAPFWYWITSTPMIRMNLGTLPVNTINHDVFDGKLLIYPNPTNGIFNLELSGVDNDQYSITVKDLLGKQVYKSDQEINNIFIDKIDLSANPRGVYLITIENSNSSISSKIILE